MRRLNVHRVKAMWMLVVTLAVAGVGDAAAGQRSGKSTVVRTDLDIWVVDSLTRVRPDEPPRRGIEAIRLKSARNEYEAAQIILRSHTPLRAVSATVTGLTGVRGNRIRKEHISLFREHYIRVLRPSQKSPFPPGSWPDALIPFHNTDTHLPLAGNRFSAGTFDLEPERNQPLWVEVYVPADTPAGLYRGVIRVTMNAHPVASVPLSLEVWDFSLPSVPSIRSDFGGWEEGVEFYRVSPGTPGYLALIRRYEDSLIRHRLMPYRPVATAPSRATDGTIQVSVENHAAVQHWFSRANSYRIPFGPTWPYADPLGTDRSKVLNYLRSYAQYLRIHGWLQYAYVYPVDEPNSATAYQQVRDLAILVHEADPDLKVLTTEQPVPTHPTWGSLIGHVNIWVPLTKNFDPVSVAERLAAGDEVWSYTALVEGNRSMPYWQLDFPLLNYRIPLWINWRYGLTGLLYWTTTYWRETTDPWVNPLSYKHQYNGEGILFYPGTAVGYDGPIPSIRLKAIRDGIEDYEYFKLLADHGDKAFADTAVRRIAQSWSEWERDYRRVLHVREELAARIVQLRQRNKVP